MPSFVLVRHKVKDFATWKPFYDAHIGKRQEAGLTERQLMRADDDPNHVILLFEAKDLGRARAFAESPDLRETMTKAGVMDRPDIFFLNG
ncbi:MAG: cyclase [Acidobacteriota bacterium]